MKALTVPGSVDQASGIYADLSSGDNQQLTSLWVGLIFKVAKRISAKLLCMYINVAKLYLVYRHTNDDLD